MSNNSNPFLGLLSNNTNNECKKKIEIKDSFNIFDSTGGLEKFFVKLKTKKMKIRREMKIKIK